MIEEGLSENEARDRIFTLDSKGIVSKDRECDLYKKKFAKDPGKFPWINGDATYLEDVIQHAGVTVLVGTSGQGGCVGCFTQEVVEAVHKNTERPVILPLSNPISVIEVQPHDIYKWTAGKALVVTGSPIAPLNYDGKLYNTRQASNVLVFPGIGLGILASGAREVLPKFFTAAAHAVSDYVTTKEIEEGCLVPKISSLKKVSQKVALAVAMCAVEEGVSRPCIFSDYQHLGDEQRMKELLKKMQWQPDYLPLVAM